MPARSCASTSTPARCQPPAADNLRAKVSVDAYLAALHDSLPPAVELDFVQGLRKYAQRLDGVRHVAAAFAGCDIKSVVDDRMSALWLQRYGISLGTQQAVVAEQHCQKLRFCRAQCPTTLLFMDDARHFACNCAPHAFKADTSLEIVPFFHWLNSGIVCSSRTPCSVNAKANKDCVQKGVGETGKSWAMTREAIMKNNVEEVCQECIVPLLQKTDEKDLSDAQFITEDLIKTCAFGFACHVQLEATDYCSPVPRSRLWWAGIRHVIASNDVCASYFHEMLSYMRHAKHMFSLTAADCLDMDCDTRVRTALRCQIPLLADAAPYVAEDGKERDYKVMHYEIYARFGLQWPPDLSKVAASGGFKLHGCTRRQAELLVLVDALWPCLDACAEAEFVDLNTGCERLLFPGCVDMDEGKLGQSPWTPHPMTLTGKVRLACRHRQLEADGTHGRIVRRFVEAHEMLRMIGWDPLGHFKPWKHECESDWEYIKLIWNMCGNAWSMFQYAPVALALIAVAGKYGGRSSGASRELRVSSSSASSDDSLSGSA